ncbi:hotdog fold thioesterase [Thermomonas flagellata]|uniref:hotdog fold thioesterase n=1 Tax=Thermomonas flagellata TaxID=2888524 RepID=UPI001F049092|nr:hotdog fold thioesterase [Thermomonas flagellata]
MPEFTWPAAATVAAINAHAAGTLMQTLGIEFTELGPGYLRARMPVDARTHQPYGLLHGGASAALAETVASVGGMLLAGGGAVVGLELNANHLRAVRAGSVTATARPLHVGRSTQVWDIRIEDGEGRLVCASRLTLAVLPQPPGAEPAAP